MRKAILAASAALMLAAGPAMAQQKSIKIGFVSTFSGPTAVIGNDMRNSFELALDHMGCLLYTSPSPRDRTRSRMPSSA